MELEIADSNPKFIMNAKSSKENILVLGGTGLFGATLMPFLECNGYFVDLHGRTNATKYNADFSDAGDAFRLLELINPAIVVNLIGLTDVDRCEAQPNEAYLVNVRTVENIVGWIKQKKAPCHLVHISTDQVYDGGCLHKEEMVTLKNCYAFSKYAGELAAMTVSSTILRANFFGRSRCANRQSITDWLFHSLSNNEPIQVFEDVLFSPLSMPTLSAMIELVIQRKPIGVFNLGSHEGMSKAELAFAFADELNLSSSAMTRSSTNQVAYLKAYRPKNMRMDCSKFEDALGVELPLLKDEIKRVAREYDETT